MKIVALISGGKDSCFNMMKCVEHGHEITCLANLCPPTNGKDELDSYMYQTVGHEGLHLYAEAMGLPLYRRIIRGKPLHIEMSYRYYEEEEKLPETHTFDEDEVEDLFEILKLIKEKHSDIEAVSVGAIFSDYQRLRVENVCRRLKLQMLAYLWHKDQRQLMEEMIDNNVEAILIKTAAIGLDPMKDLGSNLKSMLQKLIRLNETYHINICGEGGEFETFVLDCPLFKKRIVVDDSEIIMHSDDAFAPVGYLRLKKLHLEAKS